MFDGFSPATRAWLEAAFPAPTPAQDQAWAAIAHGTHVLVVAPTGSGKTLAAFLWALDRLHQLPPSATTTAASTDPRHRCRVLYVSPLKALAVDVDRNLRSPLAGIAQQARRLGLQVPEVTVAIRTGDTPAAERARFQRTPSDILITTPESLFLLLTSAARESLRGIDTVILDEVHAIAGTKRGAHLALSLERLDALLDHPAQRIGLSATVRPIDEVARWICPSAPATVVAPATVKEWDLRVEVPVDDMTALAEGLGPDVDAPAPISGSAAGAEARSSIWPHIEERLVDVIQGHRATIVFANSRRLAERITARINDIAADRDCGPIARAHHGSVSREHRSAIEEDLKAGRLPAVVATSSLELGIDMGAVDVVVQVQTPPSVASGLQRVGRAGHQVGAVSRGILLPKYQGDLVTCAVVVEGMRAGRIEALRIPRNPLDVLAQQIVAMVGMHESAGDSWTVDEVLTLARRSAPFTTLTRSLLESVLDLLSGRYPSDDFASLKPRLVWDRATGQLTGRPGSQRLAITSGGTIPDRGLFGVFLVGEKASRVGELDEEMVYESRVGDVIALGASSWRIQQITHDRVLVSPAPGQPGRLPFWHGDALGRPAELGEAVGSFLRSIGSATSAAAHERLRAAGLDDRAIQNLLAYLHQQREATGVLPDDHTIVIERFRDEIGDWRVVIHSPYGAAVHAPWALAIAAAIRQSTGLDPQVMHADDGIVLRLPDADSDEQVRAAVGTVVLEPEDVERVVTDNVAGSAMFASRFREAAARALLLPRRHPGKRSPLWQQRQRSAHLLEAVAGFPSFPIVLETVRECLQDVYDVPALVRLTERIRAGEVSIVEVQTAHASPFARSLLFGYVASFLYEGDAPLAERRAAALTVDTGLLAELLGTPELRDLLDPQALDDVEAELQHLTPDRRARDLEDAADLLRILGPLSPEQATARGIDLGWLAELRAHRRAIEVHWSTTDQAGGLVTAAIEDAARLRDALGVALPPGIPLEFCEPVADPIGDLVHRYARTHGPFDTGALATALGLAPAVAEGALQRLAAAGRLICGQFRPGRTGSEWCEPEVLRRIRRRSVARLRHEAEPVPEHAFADFLVRWQQVAAVGSPPSRVGAEGVLAVVEQLAGLSLPASAWESAVLPARVRDYHPGLLDELTTSGEVLWWGRGQLARGDGLVCLAPADIADALREASDPVAGLEDDLDTAVVALLNGSGGYFFRDISDRIGSFGGAAVDDARLDTTLWSLAWRGLVTNDSWAALRVRMGGRVARPTLRRGRPVLPRRVGPATAAGRWSILPTPAVAAEQRAAATAEVLLARYGVVTRDGVAAERLPGGFAAAYRVLGAFEQAGRCQRAYVIEGAGAAQFGTGAAIDRLRAGSAGGRHAARVILAAIDPASAYGAALNWPDLPEGVTHRPGRKSGAWVVLIGGELGGYLERGGASLLLWGQAPPVLEALAQARTPAMRICLTRINGHLPGPQDFLGAELLAAGFVHTPSGWRPRTLDR